MVEQSRPVVFESENGHLAQCASDFLVGLLTNHPAMKDWFVDDEEYFAALKTPEEVFRKLEELDLSDEQKGVVGYCISVGTPRLDKGRKKISSLGLMVRKSLELHPRFPIPEGY